jgi:very-short-patch-repair endonuclease
MIAAGAAISGSIVGAMGSVVGTWITQRHQDLRDLLAKTMVRREALYSDFITESARLIVDAMQHNESDTQKLIPVYALLSRIRLSSSTEILESAEEVIRTILDTYPKPNLTPQQIQSRAVSNDDPLRRFSDTCRVELRSIQRQL